MNELSIFTLYFLRAWSICLNKICYLSKKKKEKKEIVKHTKHLSPVELSKILIISINPKDLLLSDFSDIKFLFLDKLYNAKVFFFFFFSVNNFLLLYLSKMQAVVPHPGKAT